LMHFKNKITSTCTQERKQSSLSLILSLSRTHTQTHTHSLFYSFTHIFLKDAHTYILLHNVHEKDL